MNNGQTIYWLYSAVYLGLQPFFVIVMTNIASEKTYEW